MFVCVCVRVRVSVVLFEEGYGECSGVAQNGQLGYSDAIEAFT